MESHPSLYIKGSELSFRYTLFPEEDTLYNLDYLDSNNERHPQELAALDFESSNVPLLVSSTFCYFPAHTGYRHGFDTFHGQVVSELPRVGKSIRPSHLRHLLSRKLTDHLAPICETKHENGYISLWNRATKNWEAGAYLEIDDQHLLRTEIIIPSDESLSEEHRHDDARFASELWVLLHDFAVNLPVDLKGSASALGRVAFRRQEARQTLHIGIDRFSDACRLGMELITQLTYVADLLPGETFELSDDLSILEWDQQLANADDSTVRAICLRATTLARANNNVLNHHIFTLSADMHAYVQGMDAIQSE